MERRETKSVRQQLHKQQHPLHLAGPPPRPTRGLTRRPWARQEAGRRLGSLTFYSLPGMRLISRKSSSFSQKQEIKERKRGKHWHKPPVSEGHGSFLGGQRSHGRPLQLTPSLSPPSLSPPSLRHIQGGEKELSKPTPNFHPGSPAGPLGASKDGVRETLRDRHPHLLQIQ